METAAPSGTSLIPPSPTLWGRGPGGEGSGSHPNRFTVYGDEAVEARVSGLVADVAARFSEEFRSEEFRCLILSGGYGRGEGGVEYGPDGKLIPHNNLDFLLIARKGANAVDLKRRGDALLADAMARHGIELYLGVVPEETLLRRAPRKVLWHDIIEGHKFLAGDAQFIPSLTHHADPNRLSPTDVQALLVNRGTLLVINDLILEKSASEISAKDRRVVVRHIMKAIIGYGDALLFFLGRYHWSYVERQRRMREVSHPDIPAGFQKLYDEAAEFRFLPRYADYVDRDLVAWTQEIKARLAPVHRLCEERRLGHSFADWDACAAAGFSALLTDGLADEPLRGTAKRIVCALRGGTPAPAGAPFSARLGARVSRLREAMPLLFPTVLYPGTGSPHLRALAVQSLRSTGPSPTELRRAYLRAWGEVGDVNFPHTLRVLGLSLEPVG